MKFKKYKTEQSLLDDLKFGDLLVLLFYENDNKSIESFEIFIGPKNDYDHARFIDLFTIKHMDEPFYNLRHWNFYLNSSNLKFLRKVIYET